MVSLKAMLEYRIQFPDSECYNLASDGSLIVTNDGKRYVSPEDETTETFKDRLERSEKAGENLFFKEWKEYKIQEGAWS